MLRAWILQEKKAAHTLTQRDTDLLQRRKECKKNQRQEGKKESWFHIPSSAHTPKN